MIFTYFNVRQKIKTQGFDLAAIIRVCQISKFVQQVSICGDQYFVVDEKYFVGSPHWGSAPPKVKFESSILYFYIIMLLKNLCLEMPGTMRKESAQSDHPVQRKRPEREKILRYFDICLKQQNWTVFWMFSLGWMIRLS